jgi:hypothetical protein
MPKVVVAEDQVLKIHRVGDGPIWYLDGDKAARASDLDVHDFPDGEVALGSSRVRLLGTAENATLIARFYARKVQGRLRSVEVATPLVGASRAERANGPLMLSRMRAFAWPASLGGWHEVTPIDYAAYLLATYFQHDIASPERVDQVLGRHPLWHYVSFIPHVDRMRFARLMAIILDPRWYCRGDEVADEFHPRDYARSAAAAARPGTRTAAGRPWPPGGRRRRRRARRWRTGRGTSSGAAGGPTTRRPRPTSAPASSSSSSCVCAGSTPSTATATRGSPASPTASSPRTISSAASRKRSERSWPTWADGRATPRADMRGLQAR